MDEQYIAHHGILGQKWGVRRYQNPDGSWTELGRQRYTKSDGSDNWRGKRFRAKVERKDTKWAGKNEEKIIKKVERSVRREVKAVDRELYSKYKKQLKNGKLGYQYMFERNSRLAELMNKSSVQLTAPSGKSVRFVAKRRDMGVYIALTTPGYDMNEFKNGVFDSGKIGYRNKKANMQEYTPKKRS